MQMKMKMLSVWVAVAAVPVARAHAQGSLDDAIHRADVIVAEERRDNLASEEDDSTGDVVLTNARPRLAVMPVTETMNGQVRTVPGKVQVVLSDDNAKAKIHYTVDGSKPTAESPVYSRPIVLSAKTKVRAIAISKKRFDSKITTKTVKPATTG
jgi:hypothetical protein